MTAPAPHWFRAAVEATCEDRRVDVEGCPIHYLRWGGTGRPGLVFVHGGAAHAHWWSFIAPLLADDHAVAAIDLSGHGDSGRRDTYPREIWAREALAVADDAGFAGKPIFVGHSMGGFVCITAAADHGERLAAGSAQDETEDAYVVARVQHVHGALVAVGDGSDQGFVGRIRVRGESLDRGGLGQCNGSLHDVSSELAP